MCQNLKEIYVEFLVNLSTILLKFVNFSYIFESKNPLKVPKNFLYVLDHFLNILVMLLCVRS
jgi:hypothetical protein